MRRFNINNNLRRNVLREGSWRLKEGSY